MDQKFDEQLVGECPNLFRDRHGNPQETSMCWGFDVGDGWFPLIYDLSIKLEKLILEIPEEEREHYKASQVKEKFGGLRFYMDHSTDEMRNLIREAEELSFHLCEDCGSVGERRGGGWIRVLCDEHANGKQGIGSPKMVTLQELKVLVDQKEKEKNDAGT